MTDQPDPNDRELDLVLWGATGFTGRLVAEYLLDRYGAGRSLRWAVGGRNQQKLEQLRGEIGAATGVDTAFLPILVGDANDPSATAAIARRARVVCTTVGPYARYGSAMVAACAQAGTHYCDLTGEVQWMRRMIDSHQRAAEASGARIVHACGFDCIPSDLGVFFVQREMRSRHGVVSPHIKYRVKGFRGGASGGTIASMMNMLDEAGRDPGVWRTLGNPYGLNPDAHLKGPDGPDQVGPAYDADFGEWTGPFVMAAVDTRVVRRTNALLDDRYGRSFRYDEATLTGRGPAGLAKATAMTLALGGAMAAMRLAPVRRLAARRLPAPGDGPSREQRENGYFDVRLWAQHPSEPSKNLWARVTGDRDPGYGSTAKMLGESAVCLATDELNVAGGFWTPAAAMGELLLARLQANAGLTFELLTDAR